MPEEPVEPALGHTPVPISGGTLLLLRDDTMAAVSDPDRDKLCDEGRSTTDPAKREEIYSKALALLVDDAPWAPLVNPSEIYGVSTAVTGWAPSPTGMYRINEAAVSK